MVEHTRKELLTKIKAHLDKNEDKKPRKGGKSYATKKQGALLAYAKKLGVVKASDTVVPAVGSPAYKARAKKAAAAKKAAKGSPKKSPAKAKSPKKADKKSPAKAKSPKKAGKKSPKKAGKKSPAKSPAKGGKRACPAEIKRATVKLTLKSASRDGKACSYKLTRVNKTK